MLLRTLVNTIQLFLQVPCYIDNRGGNIKIPASSNRRFSYSKKQCELNDILKGRGHVTVNKPVISRIYIVAHT